MKILFDLITPSAFVGGAGEYVRCVFYSLIDTIEKTDSICKIIGIYDSSIGHFAYEDLSPQILHKKGIETVDVAGRSFRQVIEENHIDKVFIGAAQYWGSGKYDPWTIDIPTVCVIHDLCEEEYVSVNWNYYIMLNNPFSLFKRMIRDKIKGKTQLGQMNNILRMLKNNPDVNIVTVSNYSKSAIMYHLCIDSKKIHTLYSPERFFTMKQKVDNEVLRNVLCSNKRYYLMVGANRKMKNPEKAIKAFKRFLDVNFDKREERPLLVTLGYPYSMFDEHINLPYLSDSDLTNAYANCYAFLFPSYFEGFGYPPLEAMKFGKPVLASNVTSIPEILGDAAILFSPIYETEIFHALLKLTDENYLKYSKMSLERYVKVHLQQEKDLKQLINLILQE